MSNVWFALGLTVFAGMATGIGSILAFMTKRTNFRFLSIATGFSAGVMLYVSFVEIFIKGVDSLVESYGDPLGHWINAASFFGGMALIGIIDALIPHAENPHEIHTEFETAPLHDPNAPLPDAETLKMKKIATMKRSGSHVIRIDCQMPPWSSRSIAKSSTLPSVLLWKKPVTIWLFSSPLLEE